jgi:hypothetical protein
MSVKSSVITTALALFTPLKSKPIAVTTSAAAITLLCPDDLPRIDALRTNTLFLQSDRETITCSFGLRKTKGASFPQGGTLAAPIHYINAVPIQQRI